MGSMISIRQKGDFRRTEQFFRRALSRKSLALLREYADIGLEALRASTPSDSGETAEAWSYTIEDQDGITTLTYTNGHKNNGVNIAILLIYGHGTRNGGYVQGHDFVTPALEPVFQSLADSMWREVMR